MRLIKCSGSQKSKFFIVLKTFYGLVLSYNYEPYDNSKAFDENEYDNCSNKYVYVYV